MKYSDEQVQKMLKGTENDRVKLARHGYELETLLHDKHWTVRYTVAKQGYRLDVLVHDPEWFVRLEIAKRGYGLEILADDRNAKVRERANRYLGSKRHTVATNFGTYEGDLLLLTWDNRYLIKSGCYETRNLSDWRSKCSERLGKETAIRYTEIIQDILKEELK